MKPHVRTLLPVECGGEEHRIEIVSESEARMLDHDDTTVKAFASFGAAPPECLRLVEEWERGGTAGAFLRHVPVEIASRIGVDFAEHALPIYEAAYPDDYRVRRAIEGARDYFDDLISHEEAHALTEQAGEAMTHANDESEEHPLASGAQYAASAAWLIISPTDPDGAIDHAASSAMRAASAKPFSGIDFTKARRERLWQVAHAAAVLNAVYAGQPWPKVLP
jgi:hypothetical protein